MQSTIDRAGRVVIPIEMRRALGLASGGPIDIDMLDGQIVICAPAVSKGLEERDGLMVCVADEPLPTLTVDDVRAALESTRR